MRWQKQYHSWQKNGSPITNDSGSSDILLQCVGNRTGPTGIYKAPIFLDNLRWSGPQSLRELE